MQEYKEIPVLYEDLFVNGKLDLYPEVVGTKYFSFYLSKDSLIFQAGGYVGIIPINDRVIIDVRPRVSVKNLERLLQLTNEAPISLSHLREYPTLTAAAPSLIDILAQELIRGIGTIEGYGLHKEYVRRAEDTSFPKGRMLIGSTMQRHAARGRNHVVTASWFEHSADTAPNRCLKYAVWLLAQHYRSMTLRKGQPRIVSDLNNAFHLFDKVSLDASLSFLKDPVVRDASRLPALRSYYAPVVRLAVSIIENRGISFETRGFGVMLPSMIFDFDVVFEKYVRIVLKAHLERLSPDLTVLDGTRMAPAGGGKRLFDTSSRSENANPDVVVKREATGEYPLILDAKYKPVDYPDRKDIEQSIGYGFSYRCKNMVLIHPKREGGTAGFYPIGTMQGYDFYQYIIDLGAENPEEEEVRFAETMRELTVRKAADLISLSDAVRPE